MARYPARPTVISISRSHQFFFFSSRRRHTRSLRDWSSDVCSSDLDNAHQVASELSTRIPIYGRTTGVGANRTTAVSPTDTDYGMRLLRSHAVDAGDPLDDRTVRAMLAVQIGRASCRERGWRVLHVR